MCFGTLFNRISRRLSHQSLSVQQRLQRFARLKEGTFAAGNSDFPGRFVDYDLYAWSVFDSKSAKPPR